MERGKTRPRSDDDFVSLSSLVFLSNQYSILFKRKRDDRFYVTLLPRAATSSRTCCCCSQRESEKESTNTHSRRKEKRRRRRFCEGFLTSDLPLVFSLFFYFFGEEKARERVCVVFASCFLVRQKSKRRGDFDE